MHGGARRVPSAAGFALGLPPMGASCCSSLARGADSPDGGFVRQPRPPPAAPPQLHAVAAVR